MQQSEQKYIITFTEQHTFFSRMGMFMRKYLGVLSLFFVVTNVAFAVDFNNTPEKLIPGGKIVKVEKNEREIQTPGGTVVELEFTNAGAFKEASGDALTGGDLLVPGGDLLELKAVSDLVTKAGKAPQGDWSLEKSFVNGWVYEMEGFEKGQKMEYLVDAKLGKIIKEEIDN